MANEGRPGEQHMHLRIGAHLAGFVTDQHDIYGSDVNLTARISGLAGPGEFVITAELRDRLAPNLDADIEDLGGCYLKHIAEPVRVTLTLNKALLPGLKESQRKVRIAPNGIATLKIPGVQIQPAFQQELLGAGGSAWAQDEAKTPFVQGEVVGMILNFGPTHQSAFVYLQGTYQEIREARLLYQIDRAPEQTRTDSRYPFEFTIALPPDATSFTYHVEAVTTSGALQKTGSITLRRDL